MMASVVLVTACGGSDGGDAAPTPAPSASQPAPATEDSRSSASPESTQSGEAPPTADVATGTVFATGAEPATGKEISIDGLTFRVPDDYRVAASDSTSMNSVGTGDFALSQLVVFSVETTSPTGLPAALGRFRRRNGFVRAPRELEPVAIDGVEMFHVAGPIDSITSIEAFGAGGPEFIFDIQFVFQSDIVPPAERRRIVDSVIATMQIG